MDRNYDHWSWWAIKQDMLTAAMLGEFVMYPSRDDCRTMAIFQVADCSTGNKQIEVLWTWGEISRDSVAALTRAAEAYAKRIGAKRIFMPACKSLYRELLLDGFKATKIQMIKEV